jgi:hypothetical protein
LAINLIGGEKNMLNPEMKYRNSIARNVGEQDPLEPYWHERQLIEGIRGMVSGACFYKANLASWRLKPEVDLTAMNQKEADALEEITDNIPGRLSFSRGTLVSVPEQDFENVEKQMAKLGFRKSS